MGLGGNALDLSKIWLFSTSSTMELHMICKALEEVTVPPGRMLCEQGTIGRRFGRQGLQLNLGA